MQNITDLLQNFGYIILFAYSLGGGMVALIAASALYATRGLLDPILIISVSIAGNIIGSSALAYIARYQKSLFMDYFKSHKKSIALNRYYIKKYGLALIIGSKFIYGFKTIVPLAIGISGYSLTKFIITNALACAIWGISIGGTTIIATDFIIRLKDQYSAIFSYLSMGLIVGVILFIIIKSRKRQKKSPDIS